jgi:hypothetical protein
MSEAIKTPMIPPQEAAPITSLDQIFSILWWKFFDSVQRKLQDLQTQINAITPSGGSSYTASQTLTAASTNITWGGTAPNDGDRLTIFLTQDATGGRQITWDTIFVGATVNMIDVRASKMTIFNFVGKPDNNWHLSGPVLGGQ